MEPAPKETSPRGAVPGNGRGIRSADCECEAEQGLGRSTLPAWQELMQVGTGKTTSPRVDERNGDISPISLIHVKVASLTWEDLEQKIVSLAPRG